MPSPLELFEEGCQGGNAVWTCKKCKEQIQIHPHDKYKTCEKLWQHEHEYCKQNVVSLYIKVEPVRLPAVKLIGGYGRCPLCRSEKIWTPRDNLEEHIYNSCPSKDKYIEWFAQHGWRHVYSPGDDKYRLVDIEIARRHGY